MRQCCSRASGRSACRRSGLNPSRCTRERRSNARPLPLPNLLAPCLRPHDLSMRLCVFEAQPSNHACWVCVASRAGDAMAAGARGEVRGGRGGVASARSDVCACVHPPHVEAAVSRVRGDRHGVRVARGAACALHACCTGPPWPLIAAGRVGGASGVCADESIGPDGYSVLLSIADSRVFCTVHDISDTLRCWRVSIGH